MVPATLRAEFPVLEKVAYLNAGTCGPLPRSAKMAVGELLALGTGQGRSTTYFEATLDRRTRLRDAYAALLGASSDDVALTTCTSEGIVRVLGALDLQPGDEVLTSDEEHPGLLAPLAAARARRGFSVRVAPFAELAGEVGPSTRLVACSHVSWVTGGVVDASGLAASGASVLLDGAQGLGAVPVDVEALGCDFYAASGQKWLCGPDGSGGLFVRAERMEALAPSWPGYTALADPGAALELRYRHDAARYDVGVLPGPAGAWSLASLDLFEEAGWSWVHERAASLAEGLAAGLAERGLEVAPRGRSTLVSWRSADPEAEVRRLAEEGVVVRQLPGRGLVRASVGAWSEEEELERLAVLAGR